MGIRCANFTPISNHCACKHAPLCPLVRSYQEGHLTYILGECECALGLCTVGDSLVRNVDLKLTIRTIVICKFIITL